MRYSKDFAERLAVGTIEHSRIMMPALCKVLGGWEKIEGKRVLDIGCVSGRYARVFAQRGAQVTAIDKNIHQLNLARKHESEFGLGIDYQLVDVLAAELELAKYDIALLLYVL